MIHSNISLAPVLIFTYGNPSRGDDALGPDIHDQLLERKQINACFQDFDVLTDFQLQIEHAEDLHDREVVIFIDASVNCSEPFEFYPLEAQQDATFTTHAISPNSVLSVYQQINALPAPPAFMLSVRGYHFELGMSLSEQAQKNKKQALEFIENLLNREIDHHWLKELQGR